MIITVIGVGLIGGSMALVAKQKGLAAHVIGVEANPDHAQKALELGLVDEICELEEAIAKTNLVILAIPVNAMERVLPMVMDRVQQQVVIDTGSIKRGIIDSIRNHPKKARFVATHPMWGTEHSGPEAATSFAFAQKAVVICDKESCDADALKLVEDFYAALEMHPVYMGAAEHDVHIAYISHVSHITSFALANTVLQKEKEEDAIFELASSGFESTVRLAKSNPAMWVPVLLQNKENVLDVLEEHIYQLEAFKKCLEEGSERKLTSLIESANEIKRILK
jgi:prephenate dehydrogenase